MPEQALRKLLKGKLERPFSDLSSEASRVPRTCKRDGETGRGSQYIRCQELCLPLRPVEGAAFQIKKRDDGSTGRGWCVCVRLSVCVCVPTHACKRVRACTASANVFEHLEAERAFSLNNDGGGEKSGTASFRRGVLTREGEEKSWEPLQATYAERPA